MKKMKKERKSLYKYDYIYGQFDSFARAIAEANRVLSEKYDEANFFAEKYTFDRERYEIRFKFIEIHDGFDNLIGDRKSLAIKMDARETVHSLSDKIVEELEKAINNFKKYIVKPRKDY